MDNPDINNANRIKFIKFIRRAPTGIAFRISILMIIFIALIFSVIFMSFTFFMEDYISRDIRNQLSKPVEDVSSKRYSIIKRQLTISPRTGAVSEIITLDYDYLAIYSAMTQSLRETSTRTDVNAMIYNNRDYNIVFPTENYVLFQDLDEMENLIRVIHTNNFTEQNIIYPTSLPTGNYYLTTVDLGKLYGLDGLNGLSIAFYVSSEKYDRFIESIYTMLLIILASATAFTFLCDIFISRSISRPIQKLCDFADDIGRGNFKQNKYSFMDRELIDLNEHMNETARKLEKSDEDQKIFFQNVSHELKTPLMSIKGYAEGIKYGVFSSENEKNDASEIIISESDRLNELVADLLYISKMDATKKSDSTTKENLVELVETCADKLRGLLVNFKSENLNKTINISHPKTDIYIYCDAENMIRAIMNVASNCVRYAESAVNISFDETDDDIILCIKDDGHGIEEKDLPNIFKRFYKGKGGKHGIGLSIAKTIIEQHNAKITAKNRDDGITGAEFIIEFDKNLMLI